MGRLTENRFCTGPCKYDNWKLHILCDYHTRERFKDTNNQGAC